jgi:hypothetical protein
MLAAVEFFVIKIHIVTIPAFICITTFELLSNCELIQNSILSAVSSDPAGLAQTTDWTLTNTQADGAFIAWRFFLPTSFSFGPGLQTTSKWLPLWLC